MKKEHVDSELYEILHFNPTISAEIQDKIDTAYSQIRNNTATLGRRKKHGGFYLGFAAAIILVLGFVGFSNPVLAGKIPFVGRIFQIVGDKNSYPGNYSENAVFITNPEADSYSQTVDDITITLSEAAYTEMHCIFHWKSTVQKDFLKISTA